MKYFTTNFYFKKVSPYSEKAKLKILNQITKLLHQINFFTKSEEFYTEH